MTDALRLAVGTLTRVPVPAPRRVDRRTAGTAMLLAPVVGWMLGAGAAGVLLFARAAGAPPLLSAVAAVAALAWLTRALHWDGLADVADALGSGADPARARAIMRDPAVGAFGVLTVVLVVLAQVGALAALDDSGVAASWLVVATVTGRTAATVACVRGVRGWRAARADGLGAAVAGSVPGPAAAAVTVVVLVAAAAWGLLVDTSTWWVGPAGVVAGLLAAATMLVVTVRRVDGVTGDVLGAVVEVGATATLVLGSALAEAVP